ncbi:MAG: hypothetical protein AAFX06_24200, partial [Planctomycetota bacterium]
MTVLFVGGLILIQGSVSGREFAPSHFQTREFTFHEIPFLHLQITPVRRKVVSDPASRVIRTAGYITTPRGKPPSKWHLVSLSRGPSTTPAVASLLTNALSLTAGGGNYWQSWTTKNPKSAAALWPIVGGLGAGNLEQLWNQDIQLPIGEP